MIYIMIYRPKTWLVHIQVLIIGIISNIESVFSACEHDFYSVYDIWTLY